MYLQSFRVYDLFSPACNEWNTLVEEVLDKGGKEQSWTGLKGGRKANKAIALEDVTALEEVRMVTKDAELNRVLGGGIVRCKQ